MAQIQNHIGEAQEAVNTLLQGAQKTPAPEDRKEIFHALGTYLHDHKAWEPSFHAFKEAKKIADNNNLDNLDTSCQALFLGHYLCEWDFTEGFRQNTMDRLSVAVVPEKGPELHPWMSNCLPMEPSLRQRIAVAFWSALETHATQQERIAPYVPSDRKAIAAEYKSSGRRLRVGFSSADFKQKATAYLALSVFENLDR